LGTSYRVGILRSRLFSPLAVVIATASAEKMFWGGRCANPLQCTKQSATTTAGTDTPPVRVPFAPFSFDCRCRCNSARSETRYRPEWAAAAWKSNGRACQDGCTLLNAAKDVSPGSFDSKTECFGQGIAVYAAEAPLSQSNDVKGCKV